MKTITRTDEELRKCWLGRHGRFKPAQLNNLMEDHGFELVDYGGKAVLLHGGDVQWVDDAIIYAEERALPVVEAPRREVVPYVAEEHPTIVAPLPVPKVPVVPLEVERYVGQGEKRKGQEGYERRQKGEKWGDMPAGWNKYAKAYAKKNGLPWPPKSVDANS